MDLETALTFTHGHLNQVVFAVKLVVLTSQAEETVMFGSTD